MSLEVGLDFSCVARDFGSFRETETGSARWRKKLGAVLWVLGLSGKVDEELGQTLPRESLSSNWMILCGAN